MEYYVLTNGDMAGPFTRTDLLEKLEGGDLKPTDFAQSEGARHWTPLGRLLELEGTPQSGASAPDWRTLGVWFIHRVRTFFNNDPVRAGEISLGIGLLVLLGSFLPVLLWAPWFLAAGFASALLLRRGAFGPGALVLAAAVFLPLLCLLLGQQLRPQSEAHLLPGHSAGVIPDAGDRVAEHRAATSAQVAHNEPEAATPDDPPATAAVPAAEDQPAVELPTPELPPLSSASSAAAQPSIPEAAAQPPTTPAPARTAIHPPAAPTNSPSPPPAVAPAPTLVAKIPPARGLPPATPPPAAVDTAPGIPLPSTPGGMASARTDAKTGQLVREYSNSLVFVEEGARHGSGFVCKLKGQTFVISNVHVLAGMRAPLFTRLDGSALKPGAGAIGVGHDVVRFAASDSSRPLEAADSVDAAAEIGDEVVVLGNSEGARVILPLSGKLVGIGPNLVEVSAEFVPGNSGSPIIHVKSGKVIGVATYLVQRDMRWLSGETKEKKIRRFGYRLDSIKKWQPLAWQAFQADQAEIEKIETRTVDLARLLDDMRDDGNVIASRHQSSGIYGPVRAFVEASSRKGVSAADRAQTRRNFMAAMRSASQTDIVQTRPRLRYDYFQRALIEEERVREQFSALFDRLVKMNL